MTAVQFLLVSGLTNPYTVYACDSYGNNCILIAKINTTVPTVNKIVLPPFFNTAPQVGLKIITNDGCERFKVITCTEFFGYKKYQDDDFFIFQDDIFYQFQ